MSIPIRYCSLVLAVDDPKVFKTMHPVMKRNLEGLAFTVFPCKHDPHCRQLTEEEQADVMKRFKAPLPEE